MSGDLLIRGAEVGGAPGWDVRVTGGVVTEIGEDLRGPEPVLDAGGGALLPGLIDHHIHLLALAAQRASLRLGPDAIAGPEALRSVLRGADRTAPSGAWLRGVAYHESVAGALDRRVLDGLVPTRPLRIQHRSGALWILNSAALAAVGAMDALADCIERDAGGEPTGRIWRGDAWLRERLPDAPPPLGPVMRELAAYGVTGVTDASVTTDASRARLFETARATGDLHQRLMLMSGGGLPNSAAYRIGPVKILLDDDELGDLDAMGAVIAFARAERRAVAVHCVTAVQLAFALAAFEAASDFIGSNSAPGDRIEHGGMIDADAAAEIARLGLCVVTQPGFIAERGDQYRVDLAAEELASLYPCASLLRAGVAVAASSDAPYTHPDPWAAMAAAMRRRAPSGAVLGEAERVDGEAALALFLGTFDAPGGPARRITVGAPADLCLLHTPRAAALAEPDAALVRATVIDGVVVHPQIC
jgi:predicted amidohydrolase YtcJ